MSMTQAETLVQQIQHMAADELGRIFGLSEKARLTSMLEAELVDAEIRGTRELAASLEPRTRFEQKVTVFTDLAVALARLSACKQRSVGAVVIPADFSAVLGVGYNGPAVGSDNDSCRGYGAEHGCGCAHAEQNAVIKLGKVTDGRMVCTLSPCETCASAITNSRKITQVWYVERWRSSRGTVVSDAGPEVLERAGVMCATLESLTEEKWRSI